MTKRTLLISIPVVALVLNGLAYVVLTKTRTPTPASTASPADTRGAALEGGAGGRPRAEEGLGQGREEEYRAKEDRALARRAAGVAALEAGDYRKAAAAFAEARALLGEKAKVDELLRVAQELRANPPSSAPGPRTLAAASGSAPSRAGMRGTGRRTGSRDEPSGDPVSAAPAAAQPSGLLIVTTTPRGLLVQIDDAAVDLTPMRTKVKPGMRRIALLDGDRKVYETTVEVREGGTATVLKDLSSERVPEATRASGPGIASSGSTQSSAPLREETVRAPATAPAGTAAAAAPALTSAPARPAVPPQTGTARVANSQTAGTNPGGSTRDGGETGALTISSPGLYGVVWINGRPRGYPPLEVRDLQPGPAKVEVRVNGVQKRTSTALVRAGFTTAVNLRSQENPP